MDLRIKDTKEMLKDKNVSIFKYTTLENLVFPKDFLKFKKELSDLIKVEKKDYQIFSSDEENDYKKYIYADNYICVKNENDTIIHALEILNNYDLYKYKN